MVLYRLTASGSALLESIMLPAPVLQGTAA
jgi:hypothetical protein